MQVSLHSPSERASMKLYNKLLRDRIPETRSSSPDSVVNKHPGVRQDTAANQTLKLLRVIPLWCVLQITFELILVEQASLRASLLYDAHGIDRRPAQGIF